MLINFLKNEYFVLKSFINDPLYVYENRKIKSKVLSLAFILSIDVILMLLLLLSISVFNLEELFQANKISALFNSFPLWSLGLLLIIIIPILEEFIFRFHLKYKKWVINIIIPLLVSSVLYLLLSIFNLNINYLILLVSSSLLYFIYTRKYPQEFKRIWDKKFKVVFYITAFIFSLAHVSNYSLSNSVLLIIPLLILPQFILGVLIGYLRVKSGFFWGILLHVFHNAIFLLPFMYSLHNDVININIKNEKYSLNIQDTQNFDRGKLTSNITTDSVIINNQSLKKSISLLLGKEERFIKSNNNLREKKRIKIAYRTNVNFYESDISKVKKNIFNELEKVYDFKTHIIKRDTIQLVVFIKDSLMFQKYKSIGITDGSFKTVGKNKIYIKNGSIKDLTESLNNAYSENLPFSSIIDEEYKFSINIDSISFEHLQSHLENYGLSYEREKREIEFIKIDF